MSEFSGNLELDSPICNRLIGSIFGQEFLSDIRKLYFDLSSVSEIQEPNCARKKEVKFNPRPARITDILLSEAKCIEKSVIRSAFELSFDKNSLVIENLLKPESLKIDILQLSSYLDELRHLHMHPMLTRKQLNHALEFTDRLEQDGFLDLNQRLKDLIINYKQKIIRRISLV